MRTTNSFGVHFILRMNKVKNGSAPIYARISVNGERIEMSLRKTVKVIDWNNIKGLAKPKTTELKTLNNELEKARGMVSSIYQNLSAGNTLVTAGLIKNRFLGIEQQEHTLQSLMDYHNLHMTEVLAPGTIKNYYTTVRCLVLTFRHKVYRLFRAKVFTLSRV